MRSNSIIKRPPAYRTRASRANDIHRSPGSTEKTDKISSTSIAQNRPVLLCVNLRRDAISKVRTKAIDNSASRENPEGLNPKSPSFHAPQQTKTYEMQITNISWEMSRAFVNFEICDPMRSEVERRWGTISLVAETPIREKLQLEAKRS